MQYQSVVRLAVAVSMMLAVACSKSETEKPAKAGSPIETALAAPGAVIVDVRSKSEWHQGHVPGAVHVPMSELSSIGDKIPDRKTQIVVHCAAGVRSHRAKQILTKMGYTNIFDAKTPDAVARAKGVALVR